MYLLPKKFFSKCSTGHIDFNFWTLVENFCQKLQFFQSKSTNRVKIMFFFRERNLLSQNDSLNIWHAVLTSLTFLFHQKPETFSLRAQNFEKFSSSRKVWFGKSPGHLECLPDEPGVFLQINVSSEKPWEKNRIVSSSEEFFLEKFYWSRRFQFWHPCRKHLPTFGISSFKISKQSQNYFFWKKRFVSECFSGHMECCFDKSAGIVSPRNRHKFPVCPKGKKICFKETNFCSKCSSVHLECLPGSSKVYLKCLWTRRFQFDTTIGYFCQDSGTLPLDVGKMIQSVFFEKKSFHSKSFSDHMDCSFGISVKLVLAVTPKDLSQTPKVWKVLFLLGKCP